MNNPTPTAQSGPSAKRLVAARYALNAAQMQWRHDISDRDNARAVDDAIEELEAAAIAAAQETPPAGARDAVREAVEFLRGVRVFVTSKERIKHPEGTDLFDKSIAALAALTGKADGGEASNRAIYTMCAHCNSVQGGHTLACQAIYADGGAPAQIPIPDDSPWLQRRRAEEAKAPQPAATGAGDLLATLKEMHERWLSVSKDYDAKGMTSVANVLYDASRELETALNQEGK